MVAEHTLLYQIAKVMKHSMCFLSGEVGGKELKPGSTLTTDSGVSAPTEPELPAMHVRSKRVQFVSAAPRDREEVRMRMEGWGGGMGGKDEHVANRSVLVK